MSSTLVVGNLSAKSWAITLDYAVSLSGEVFYANTAKLETQLPVTLKRRKFQKFVIREFRLREVKISRNYLQNFWLIFYSVKYWKLFCFNSNNNLQLLGYNIFNLLQCRIAAYMGHRNFDLRQTPFRIFHKHFVITLRVLIKTDGLVKNMALNKLVVYNGREPANSTVILVANKYNIPVEILERGSSHSKYQTFAISPHYHPEWWDLIKNFQFKLSDQDQENYISTFIDEKLNGVDKYFDQEWNSSRKNAQHDESFLDLDYIVYFTSSSTEYSPFEMYNSKLGYQDQFSAVEDLAMSCERLNKTLIIKRHPRSIGVDGTDREHASWNEILEKFKSVKYLPPDAQVNSYQLANNAIAIFVWKSSIGFETMAMGIPTYALGPAKWAWDTRFQVWNASRIEESLITLTAPDLEIVKQYALFMSLSGVELRLFRSVNKWGVVSYTHGKILNLVGQRARSRIYDLFLEISGRERKRNA
jgi:hypothetical protein